MTVWKCHNCGEPVHNDKVGYNFFMDKYYCDPDCAENDGIDIDLEYDDYGDPKDHKCNDYRKTQSMGSYDRCGYCGSLIFEEED